MPPAAYAAELAALVNAYRKEAHAPPLTVDPTIATLARGHSEAMARAKRMSHDDFQARFRRSGYGMCVENVGWNYPTARDQLDAWRASPGHDRNHLDARVKHVGVGGSDGWPACR